MFPIISFLIQYRHYIGYGFAIVAALGALWYVKHTGYRQCEQDKAIAVAEAYQKAHKNREATEHETKSMSKQSIIDEFRALGELRPANDI